MLLSVAVSVSVSGSDEAVILIIHILAQLTPQVNKWNETMGDIVLLTRISTHGPIAM